MKRTAADRRAEAARMREFTESLRTDNEATQYLTKLMTALEEATRKSNYELEVRDGMFHLRDEPWRDAVVLSPTYNQNSWDALQSLEWDLQLKAEERVEAERLAQVRRQAFLKLSKEEQDALGLTDRNNW